MRIFILLVSLPFLLFGKEISFMELKQHPDEMQKHHLEEVEIWGFLHQGDEGNWVISPEPSLRSCCIQSEKKIFEQIALSPPFEGEPTPYPVKVKGIFKVDPREEGWGGFSQFYIMENSVIEETSSERSTPYLLFFSGIAAALFGGIYLYSKRHS